jgi:hypothetical protein
MKINPKSKPKNKISKWTLSVGRELLLAAGTPINAVVEPEIIFSFVDSR